VFFSWLDHNDVKEDNSIDMWVADPADPRRRYVKHYLLDFGTSLGAAALFSADLRQAHAYHVDWPDMFASLATLGLRERSWERRRAPALRGVGVLDIETYDPGAWKAETPAYVPFRTSDDLDKLWAAKILIRFTRAQIAAVVETARLSDPRAAAFLTDALVARQRATARHWFSRVPPLDRFAVAGGAGALCFTDLLLAYELAPAWGSTRYDVAAYDRGGRPLGSPATVGAGDRGRACAAVTLAGGRDGYTIVRIETRRRGFSGETFVHVARDPATGTPRVIGVWRP
jgi:hypothetical protein